MNNFISFLMIVSLLSMPFGLFANTGLPMIYLAAPVYALLFIPIVVIEVIYLSNRLRITKRLALKTVFISNLLSTIIGIPLTWLILVTIQLATGGGGNINIDSFIGKILSVTWQAPWLLPHSDSWMIPAASLFLLVPFYFTSFWSECLISQIILDDYNILDDAIKIAVRNANLITYTLLTFWPISTLVYSEISMYLLDFVFIII